MRPNESNATLDDVLASIQNVHRTLTHFVADTHKHFTENEKRFAHIESTIDDLLMSVNSFSADTHQRFEQVNERFEEMNGRLTTIEASMVTKDYLDRKMAEQRGEMVSFLKKEDAKVSQLTEILAEKKLLTREEKTAIIVMGPFVASRIKK